MSATSTAVLLLPGATATGIQASIVGPVATPTSGVDSPTTYSVACGAYYTTLMQDSCFVKNFTIATTPPSGRPTSTAIGDNGLPVPNYSFEGYVADPDLFQQGQCYIVDTTSIQYCIFTASFNTPNVPAMTTTVTDTAELNVYNDENFVTVTITGVPSAVPSDVTSVQTTGPGATATAPSGAIASSTLTGAAAMATGGPVLGGIAAVGLAIAGFIL